MTLAGPIVGATDLTAAGRSVVDLAAALARATHRRLCVVHVGSSTPPPDFDKRAQSEAEKVYRERVHQRLERETIALHGQSQRAKDLDAESVLLEGRPWQAIVEFATRSAASLLVIGPHAGRGAAGPNPWSELILGRTADRLVRYAPCPVLVTRPAGRGATTEPPPGQNDPNTLLRGPWLVAVDESEASKAALRLTRDLAEMCGAEWAAVHVALGPPPPGHAEEGPKEGLAGSTHPPSEDAGTLATRRWVHGEAGRSVELKVGLGDPADLICEAIDASGARMIVMGTHGRTGLSHLVLGSVAERTLRRAAVPVLVVRPEEG